MINIAELLKNCPKGTKLYSPLFGECKLERVEDEMFIHVKARYLHDFKFDEHGQLPDLPIGANINGECLLFPSRDCRTWEGWNPPVEPKFKVGDRIRWINHDVQNQTITDIKDDSYITVDKYGIKCALKFIKQDEWELVQPNPHYDISNFHTGMPVLVRPDNDCSWDYSVFSRITGNEYWKFSVCNGVSFTQCIPFEGNEHLLGTTDMPSEEYINW